jgi:hypothetical protein
MVARAMKNTTENFMKILTHDFRGPHGFTRGPAADTFHVARRMSVALTSITVITHSFGIATMPEVSLLSSLERNEVAVTVG